jgi:hypothetical protein
MLPLRDLTGGSHAPDYFARRRDGSALVVDVRDGDRISSDDQQKFDRSAAVCESVGWNYRRIGVLDPVHDEPHRIYFRDSAFEVQGHQGAGLAGGRARDGVQRDRNR